MNDFNENELSNTLSEQFPQNNDICYLNHAAVSPWPKVTADAVTAFANENLTQGATHYPKWMKVEQSLRLLLKRLINADSVDEIALAKNTSEALSIIAYGIEWQDGDEVIISNQEFPSNRIVWESLAQFGVKLKIADFSGTNNITSIQRCITSKTRLISISSVQYSSGMKIDLVVLGKLCRERQILFCIDAIQSLGALPFDQRRIQADFIVADGHKWMMAAEGLALLYVKSSLQADLKLQQFGWHMVEKKGLYDELNWEPANNATRFECGSPNMLGIHALQASLEFLLKIGIDTIAVELNKRINHTIKLLSEINGVEFISPIENDERAGIICFKILRKDLAKLQSNLMKKGVICAYRGGGIRFSPHFYTPYKVLDKSVEILKSLLVEE